MVAVSARHPARTFGSEKIDDFVSLLMDVDGLLTTWRRSSRARCGGILLPILELDVSCTLLCHLRLPIKERPNWFRTLMS